MDVRERKKEHWDSESQFEGAADAILDDLLGLAGEGALRVHEELRDLGYRAAFVPPRRRFIVEPSQRPPSGPFASDKGLRALDCEAEAALDVLERASPPVAVDTQVLDTPEAGTRRACVAAVLKDRVSHIREGLVVRGSLEAF